jgi:hypothetical protein
MCGGLLEIEADAAARTFNLQLFSLIDQSSGKTQLLSRL